MTKARSIHCTFSNYFKQTNMDMDVAIKLAAKVHAVEEIIVIYALAAVAAEEVAKGLGNAVRVDLRGA